MKSVKKIRKFGKGTIECRKCQKKRGVISKYGLRYCRNCFKELAKELGFKKFG